MDTITWRYVPTNRLTTRLSDLVADLQAPYCCGAHNGKGLFLSGEGALVDKCLQAKTELASHGAKAYFTRG